MENLTIALAITALIMAVLGIGFNVAFFTVQSRQANAMTKENAAFAKEMSELLGHIRGVTLTTQHELQNQFRMLLTATIENYQGAVQTRFDEETSPAFQKLSERINRVESLSSSSPDSDKIKAEVSDLKSQVEAIKKAQKDVVSTPITLDTSRLHVTSEPFWWGGGTLSLGDDGKPIYIPQWWPSSRGGKGGKQDVRGEHEAEENQD